MTVRTATMVALVMALAAVWWLWRRERAKASAMTEMMMTATPPGWGSDELTAYADLVRKQQFATYFSLRAYFDKMLDVDAAFDRLKEDLVDPEDLIGPFFLLQSHAALRAAATLALGTQSSPAFGVMRQVLEQSIYGLYISQKPDSFETWIKRSVDEESRQKMKNEFKIGTLKKVLETVDAEAASRWLTMYEKTIDFGAHPNPAALVSALNRKEHDKGIRFEVAYLTKNEEVIRGTMKSVAQTGVISLMVFRHVFPKRFEALGLNALLPSLMVGL